MGFSRAGSIHFRTEGQMQKIVFRLHCMLPITLLSGQGQSSGSRSKVEVKVRGQLQRSCSNVWCVVVDIRGLACQVQRKAITLKFGAKNDHYQSAKFVCVPVIAVDRLLILANFVKGLYKWKSIELCSPLYVKSK